MNTPTNEQVQKRYESLPEKIKDALLAVETADAIRAISERRQLHVDKMGELADEVGLMLLGFVRKNDFIPHLRERLQVSTDVAQEIAGEVEKEIFSTVKMALKEDEETSAPSAETVQKEPPQEIKEQKAAEPQLAHLQDAPPQNLPTENKPAQQDSPEPKTKPFSEDPYREPIEDKNKK